MKSMGAASELLTIRPNLGKNRFVAGSDPVLSAAVIVVIGAAALALGLSNPVLITFECLLPVMVVALAWRWLYFRLARITVDGQTVTMVGWSLRPRSIPRAAVSRLVLTSRMTALGSDPTILVFAGSDGRSIMKTTGHAYVDGDMHQLALVLGVPISQHSPTKPSDLAREIPGSVAWWERHATTLGVAIGIAGTILVIVLLATLGH